MPESELNIFAVFPSRNPERCRACVTQWKEQGYRCGVLIDFEDDLTPYAYKAKSRFYPIIGPPDGYMGYWNSVNRIITYLLRSNVSIDIVVAIGDDMRPDPNSTAQEIGREYLEYFTDGFGIMQPCGDPQGVDKSGQPAAARICGSPWFGRGWIEEAYGGNGPMPGQYFHYFGDELLKADADALGVLWMRPDLTQYHLHWSFGHSTIQSYQAKNQEYWAQDQEQFERDKAKGFPSFERKVPR